jgi:hypothetical protein
MGQSEFVRLEVPDRGDRKRKRARAFFSIGQSGVGTAVAADPKRDNEPTGVVVAARPLTDDSRETTERPKSRRPKAIVIDPDESGRVFVAEALTLFEPGFEVVTVAGVDEAAEWMQTFSPDLLVVSESLEQHEATSFVAGLLATPDSRHCKVVSVGNGEAVMARWRHAALGRGAGLSEWLETVRYVLAG